jgi:hypothetical protein
MGEASDKKFHEQELPRILQAIKDARDRKENACLTIQFSHDGGVIAVTLEAKKLYK